MIAAVFTTIHGNREYSHLFGMIRYFELWGEITTVVHTEYSFLVIYDRVSDVVENGGRFASKILTHNRMH